MVDITEEEIRSKTAQEIYDLFPLDIQMGFDSWKYFKEQDDVSFELIKDIHIWGTYGPPDNKHPLKWVFLKDCSSEHLHNIRKSRNNCNTMLRRHMDDGCFTIEDYVDSVIVSILADRGDINTCNNCDLLRRKYKFGEPRYYCNVMGCRAKPGSYLCVRWVQRTPEHSFEGTIKDYC